MTVLSILWYFLIFLLIAAYFILDGFDLGAGILYPFVAKDEDEKRIVRQSIGPVWDGNEVWLLTAGGALFAAFPAAYATTFSGFYLAIMLVLFSLIVRAVAIEWRRHDYKWHKIWDGCFFVGSLLPALLLGVAVGNIIAGIPLNEHGDYTGLPLIGLITPFTLLCGVLGLGMFISAGAAWLALKAPEDSTLRQRARAARPVVQTITLVIFVITFVYGVFGIDSYIPATLAVPRFACLIIFLAAMAVGIFFNRCDLWPFILQSIAAVALVFLIPCSMFPDLVVNTAGNPIDILSAASGDLTLAWMTGIACVGVPLVLVYHIISYRIFRGRIEAGKDEDY